jgi:hypothetical protein
VAKRERRPPHRRKTDKEEIAFPALDVRPSKMGNFGTDHGEMKRKFLGNEAQFEWDVSLCSLLVHEDFIRKREKSYFWTHKSPFCTIFVTIKHYYALFCNRSDSYGRYQLESLF